MVVFMNSVVTGIRTTTADRLTRRTLLYATGVATSTGTLIGCVDEVGTDGEPYEIDLLEGDGVHHNIEIWDENDGLIDDYRTSVTEDPDEGQTLEITPPMRWPPTSMTRTPPRCAVRY